MVRLLWKYVAPMFVYGGGLGIAPCCWDHFLPSIQPLTPQSILLVADTAFMYGMYTKTDKHNTPMLTLHDDMYGAYRLFHTRMQWHSFQTFMML